MKSIDETRANTPDTHSRNRFALTTATLGIAAALAVSGGMVGCNTVDGAGEDLQEASQNVEREIED